MIKQGSLVFYDNNNPDIIYIVVTAPILNGLVTLWDINHNIFFEYISNQLLDKSLPWKILVE